MNGRAEARVDGLEATSAGVPGGSALEVSSVAVRLTPHPHGLTRTCTIATQEALHS